MVSTKKENNIILIVALTFTFVLIFILHYYQQAEIKNIRTQLNTPGWQYPSVLQKPTTSPTLRPIQADPFIN